jgi:nucleoside-triphosphatase THEP1
MANYDFKSLSPIDFEELTRDLLQRELNITLETFKAGKDNGIDLRYSTNDHSNKTIIQAKHYIVSGYNKLLQNLKKELEKVKKINPKSYIISTSVPLNPQNKEDIQKLFHPFIQKSADIYGSGDLNNLLGKFPEIEKQHYKLWLSSSNVLELILKQEIFARSFCLEEEIKQNINIFVETSSINEALNILEKQKFLIIKGEPGIGKTTLAKQVIYRLISEDYEIFELDSENINKFYDIAELDTDKKQCFFIDDFLGANYYEIRKQNYDSDIAKIMSRIRNSQNKYILLTTRTHILSQAKEKHQKLREGIFSLNEHEYEIKIGSYSKLDKAKILYNHIFYNLNDENQNLLEHMVLTKEYLGIINHRNFSPRLVEFICRKENIKNKNPNQYLKFVKESFDNPEQIWRCLFEQTSPNAQLIILTMFSLRENHIILYDTLKQAFEKRYDYEVKHNHYPRELNKVFEKAFKELEGSFLVTRVEPYSEKRLCDFFNPSISDFLLNYIFSDSNLIEDIIKGALFVDQIKSITFEIAEKFNNSLKLEAIYNAFKERVCGFNDIDTIKSQIIELDLLEIEVNFFKHTDNEVIHHLIEKLNLENQSYKCFQNNNCKFILDLLIDNDKDIIRSRISEINEDLLESLFLNLISSLNDIHSIEYIGSILYLLPFDYHQFIQSNEEIIIDSIHAICESAIEESLDLYCDGSSSFDEAKEFLSALNCNIREIFDNFRIHEPDAIRKLNITENENFKEKREAYLNRSDESLDNLKTNKSFTATNKLDEDSSIHDLFSTLTQPSPQPPEHASQAC